MQLSSPVRGGLGGRGVIASANHSQVGVRAHRAGRYRDQSAARSGPRLPGPRGSRWPSTTALAELWTFGLDLMRIANQGQLSQSDNAVGMKPPASTSSSRE